MKRAFDIFSTKGKGGGRKEALDKSNKLPALKGDERELKRRKQFEMTAAQKQRSDIFREVIGYGEKGLEGDAAAAANYRWKKSLGIPMKKVNIPYPQLKQKLLDRENLEVAERVKRSEDGLAKFTRAPVIAHKKPKHNTRDKAPEPTLQVMPGKYVGGAVQLQKKDISRIYSDVKKKTPKAPKKKDAKKKKGKKH